MGRTGHGMGILKIKGIPKLVVFGGRSYETQTNTSIVEVWNDDTETWHIAEGVELSLCSFGYCSSQTFINGNDL